MGPPCLEATVWGNVCKLSSQGAQSRSSFGWGVGAGSRCHPRMTAELGSVLHITDFAGLKDLKVRDLGRRTAI